MGKATPPNFVSPLEADFIMGGPTVIDFVAPSTLPMVRYPVTLKITSTKIADAHSWRKKTYNNAISALRRAFEFGFLDYPERHNPAAALKCSRMGKKDRPRIDPFSIQEAEVLIAALHRDWGEAQGNYDELRFFTRLRPSEEIALLATDYDAAKGVLNITKARVCGIDQDVTKTGEDGRIVLCPRAVAIIERQLRLRERLVGDGLIHHDHLFFTESGAPMADLKYAYWRWQRTLRRLAIRYRKPYMARHTSVSWSLMLGRNRCAWRRSMATAFPPCSPRMPRGSKARSKPTSARSAMR
jgi:integrase